MVPKPGHRITPALTRQYLVNLAPEVAERFCLPSSVYCCLRLQGREHANDGRLVTKKVGSIAIDLGLGSNCVQTSFRSPDSDFHNWLPLVQANVRLKAASNTIWSSVFAYVVCQGVSPLAKPRSSYVCHINVTRWYLVFFFSREMSTICFTIAWKLCDVMRDRTTKSPTLWAPSQPRCYHVTSTG